MEDLAGDLLRVVGAQRDDDGRDVRGVERVEARGALAHLEGLLGHARARVRCEAVHSDAVAGELLRGDDREARDARLRRAVVRLADVPEHAGRARGVDHPRAQLLAGLRALAPVRGRVAGDGEVTLQVHGDHCVPFGLFHVHEHAVAEDARVVHDDVEAAERVDRVLDEPAGALEVGDVLAVGDRLSVGGLDLCDHLLGRRQVGALARERPAEVVHDHLRAGGGERERVRATDAAARAGDDCDLAAQIGHGAEPTGATPRRIREVAAQPCRRRARGRTASCRRARTRRPPRRPLAPRA